MRFIKFPFKRKKNITALVMGSGAARGFAHIGVLKALDDHRIPIDMIVGTSMGGLIGGFYSAGIGPKALIEWIKSGEWKAVLSIVDPVRDLSGLIGGRRIEKMLEDSFGSMRFEGLRIPLTVVATDILRGEMVAISKGNLANGIRATISVPGVFKPVRREGRYLVDGGVVDPLPVDVAYKLGAKNIIAVDVGVDVHKYYEHKKKQRLSKIIRKNVKRQLWLSKLMEITAIPSNVRNTVVERVLQNNEPDIIPKMIDILLQTLYIMQSEIIKTGLKDFPPACIIKPEIDHISAADFDKAEEIVGLGEKAALKSMHHIKKILKIK